MTSGARERRRGSAREGSPNEGYCSRTGGTWEGGGGIAKGPEEFGVSGEYEGPCCGGG